MNGRPALFAGGLMLLLVSASQAALPPLAQRRVEIERILQNRDVQRSLRDQPVDKIERVGNDLYQVQAGPCSVIVDIIDAPTPRDQGPQPAGARRFDLRLRPAQCR